MCVNISSWQNHCDIISVNTGCAVLILLKKGIGIGIFICSEAFTFYESLSDSPKGGWNRDIAHITSIFYKAGTKLIQTIETGANPIQKYFLFLAQNNLPATRNHSL
jgi:hypothetical protein